jgi:ornithine cyclodeaminase
MVSYLGVSDIQRLVNRIGPATFIERLAGEIEADYARWEEFEKSARLASHSPVGVIELMPTSDSRLYSFKYVNGHPQNTAAGLLTVTAFGVLADVATGYPLLLSELTITTALRTAAMSALVARHLARPDSRVMALIGCGAQAEFQTIGGVRITALRLSAVTVVTMSAPRQASAVDAARVTLRSASSGRPRRLRSSLTIASGSTSNSRSSRMPSRR